MEALFSGLLNSILTYTAQSIHSNGPKENGFQKLNDISNTPDGKQFSRIYATSDDGNTVVGNDPVIVNDSPSFQAAIWTPEHGVQDLPPMNTSPWWSTPVDQISQASGISADGRIVVGYVVNDRNSTAGGIQEVFIWTAAGGIQSLDSILSQQGLLPEHAHFVTVKSISADGQTVIATAVTSNSDIPSNFGDSTQIYKIHLPADFAQAGSAN